MAIPLMSVNKLFHLWNKNNLLGYSTTIKNNQSNLYPKWRIIIGIELISRPFAPVKFVLRCSNHIHQYPAAKPSLLESDPAI